LLGLCQTLKLECNPLSDVYDCVFSVFGGGVVCRVSFTTGLSTCRAVVADCNVIEFSKADSVCFKVYSFTALSQKKGKCQLQISLDSLGRFL